MIDKNYAIYQYLIDHSCVLADGSLSVQLYFRDEADFWRRVKARQEGFRRYSVPSKEILQAKNWSYYNYYISKNAEDKKRKKRIEEIKVGSLKERILYYLFKRIKKSIALDG